MELLVLLLVILAVDRSGVLGREVIAIQPHPFWVPVILAASLYGRPAGYALAFASALVDAALRWKGAPGQMDFYAEWTDISANAVLWLATAAVLGRFREKHLDRLKETSDARDRKAQQAEILAQRCHALAREMSSLELRLASSGAASASAVLGIFTRVLQSPTATVPQGIAQALNRLIGANDVRLLLPSESGWSALCLDDEQVEVAQDAAAARRCDLVVAADRVFSSARQSDGEVLDGFALAAPVHSSDGSVAGILAVREIDPACLTSAGEAALSLASFILGSRYVAAQATIAAQEKHKLIQYRHRPELRIVNQDSKQVGS